MSVASAGIAAAPVVPRHRVLVVDDQALIGTSVQRMLAGQADMEVQFRRDATSAVQAAISFGPTVILQDLVMPDVAGAEMVRRFRALPETAHVPVIVLSAVEEPAVKAELLAGGAADYLVKLPDPIELAARVRMHSECMRDSWNATPPSPRSSRPTPTWPGNGSGPKGSCTSSCRAIAERLKSGPQVIADVHADVTVLFADMSGFTELTSRCSPREIVELLDEIFARFDELAATHGIEKIKTIGDAWMAVAGIPEPRPDHVEAMADLALELVRAFDELATCRQLPTRLRIGLHTGPVVAGVIGRDRYAYDLWGDTVNLASRMESHGEPGRVHLTATTAARLGEAFEIVDRGEIVVKGKGPVRTAFLVSRRPRA